MILCCRIPDIRLAAFQLKHGNTEGERPIVIGGHPSEKKPVLAASEQARAFGICAGMPLRQAEQLCPEALFVADDPTAEHELGLELVAGPYAMAPRVELGAGDGEAYVDLAGLGKNPVGYALGIGEYLEGRIHSRPQLGIGVNKHVAFTAAGTHRGGSPVVVPDGAERAFLAPLPLAGHLPLEGAMVERLRAFGIITLGGLAAIPGAELRAQLGEVGALAVDLARGVDRRPLFPWQPPEILEERSVLDPPIDNREPLLFVTRALVDRLGARLVEAGSACTTAHLTLEMEDGTTLSLALRLRVPASSGEEMWTTVSAAIRHQALDQGVAGLRLGASGFCPARSRQLDILTRRDRDLDEIVGQLALLAHSSPELRIGMARLDEPASPLDQRRYSWRDPIVTLIPPPTARRTRRARAS